MPKISVLLPVFNCAEYVEQAIDSVLDQTFKDFELIIFDDGSTDDTLDRICGYEGHKSVFILSGKHVGAAAALNCCLKVSDGEFIARQDGDDWSYPNRFEKQLEYLEKHRDVKAVGSGMRLIGDAYDNIYYLPSITKSMLIKHWPCVAHPTIMMRSKIFNEIGGYDASIEYCEDYDLWMRIIDYYGHGTIRNLADILYTKREHDKTNTAKGKRNGLIKLYNEMVLLKSRIREAKNE